ncbi:MAG: hypothetical protein ACRBBU_02540 [Pseudooceanicola sp.]
MTETKERDRVFQAALRGFGLRRDGWQCLGALPQTPQYFGPEEDGKRRGVFVDAGAVLVCPWAGASGGAINELVTIWDGGVRAKRLSGADRSGCGVGVFVGRERAGPRAFHTPT